MADSEPVTEHCKKTHQTLMPLIGVKNVLMLFLVFLVVSSDIFNHSVLSLFSKTTDHKSLTAYGTVIQGIFLVLAYCVGVHLMDSGTI